MAKLPKRFTVDKYGKITKHPRKLSVSERIRQKKSKRVRVVTRTQTP